VPRDTAWFSWFDGKRVIPLQEQEQLWHEDRLGLRHLHKAGRLHFDEVSGDHMQFSLQELYGLLDKYMAYEKGETEVLAGSRTGTSAQDDRSSRIDAQGELQEDSAAR
jgi:Palmitoyl protein thioesterase